MHSCNYQKVFANRWQNFPSVSNVLTLKGVIWNQINHSGNSLRWLIQRLEGLFRAFVLSLVTGLSSHKDWTQTRGHVSKNISFSNITARTKIELNKYATLYSPFFSGLDYLIVSVVLLYQKLKIQCRQHQLLLAILRHMPQCRYNWLDISWQLPSSLIGPLSDTQATPPKPNSSRLESGICVWYTLQCVVGSIIHSKNGDKKNLAAEVWNENSPTKSVHMQSLAFNWNHIKIANDTILGAQRSNSKWKCKIELIDEPYIWV